MVSASSANATPTATAGQQPSDINTILTEVQQGHAPGSPKSPPKKLQKRNGILKSSNRSSTKKRSNNGSSAAVTPATPRVPSPDLRPRKHEWIVLSWAVKLLKATSSQEAQQDLMHTFREWFAAMKELDNGFCLEHLDPNQCKKLRISEMSQFPTVLSKFSFSHVKLSAPYQLNPKTNRETGEVIPPLVYGTLVISCDEALDSMLCSGSIAWSELGGTKLEKKQHQAVHTSTVAVALSVHNGVTKSILEEETQRIFEKAAAEMKEKGEIPPEHENDRVPVVSITLSELASTRKNKKKKAELSYAQQQQQKVPHIEVDSKEAALALLIVEYVIQNGHFHIWGKWAKVSGPIGKDATLSQRERAAEHLQQHIRFNQGTAVRSVPVSQVDAPIRVPLSDGSDSGTVVCLRSLLLRTFKTCHGKLLFASVHQGDGEIEVVIPDDAEFHRALDMFLKNVAGYIHYYLVKEAKMDEAVVGKIIDKTVNPALLGNYKDCEWDGTTFTLTTPEDKDDKAHEDDLFQQPWMLDLQQVEADRKKKPQKAAFCLDGQPSLGTMHPQNDEKRKSAVQFSDNAAVKTTIDLLDDDDDNNTGCHPTDDKTSPASTNSEDDSISIKSDEMSFSGVDGAANMA